MSRPATVVLVLATSLLTAPRLVAAQAPAATAPASPAPAAVAQDLDPDLRPIPAEPDFTLGALPTTLRLPSGKGAFHLTHRFTRPINSGTVGDFFSDLFGFDSAGRIGLEFRYGLRPGTQFDILRTNDRTIQMTVQHDLLGRSDDRPLSAHALLAVEGRNNFGLSDEIAIPDADVFSTTIGAVLSRRFGTRGAVYLQPLAVLNSNVDPAFADEDDHSFLLGLGARVRVWSSVYVFVEAAPRVAGFSPDNEHVSLGIEKRLGGHIFQLNFSNSLGTTMGQLARGGPDDNDWFIGFNLTRKFY